MTRITTRAYPDLATWRADKGLSQQKAANLLGLSQAYYSRLERKLHALPGIRAKAVMEQTGVPIEVLVGAA